MLSQLPQRSAQPATTARGSHAAPSSVAWRGAASAGGMRLAPSQRPLSRRGCRLGRVHSAAAAGGAPPDASAPTPVPAPDMTLEPFKSLVAGRRFSCTMCGKCCTGDGEIWLAPEEIPRIAKHLNLSTQRFLDTYTKQYSKYRGWRMLKTAGDSGQSCVFLSPLDGKTCLVHSVRPSQCSTYPWWPELMHDAEWDWEKANICEGFDHADAPELDVEEAARQLKEANTMTQLRLLASNVRVTPKEMDWATRVLVWEEEDGEEGPGGGGAAAKEVNAGKQGKGPKPEKGGKRK